MIEEYTSSLQKTISDFDVQDFYEIVDIIETAIERGNRIFIAGNGGNAATASHITCDLQKSLNGVKIISLCDNMAIITAWSNDFDFNDAYAEEIARLAEKGDVFIALSASGTSTNMINAIEVASAHGVITLGISGALPDSRKVSPGNTLAVITNHAFIIPSDDMQIIEDATLILGHMIFRELLKRQKY